MEKLIVVRHSERLDEVDQRQWNKIVEKKFAHSHDSHARFCFGSDPPITSNGVVLSRDAAATVLEIIKANPSAEKRVVLYSSKLLRCVQTCYEIATQLKLPMHVSTGLALTAAAVESCVSAKHGRSNSFNFLSLEEIQAHCPRTTVHCCDDENSSHYIPMNHWRDAMNAVNEHNRIHTPHVKDNEAICCINIVVAHRETIRNLLNRHLKLPYCCIAMFDIQHSDSSESADETIPESLSTELRSELTSIHPTLQPILKKKFVFLRLMDRHGKDINFG